MRPPVDEYVLPRPVLLISLCVMGLIWWIGAVDAFLVVYSILNGG